MKVRITWHGMGGELDRIEVTEDTMNDKHITQVFIKFIENDIVSPGDWFTVREVD